MDNIKLNSRLLAVADYITKNANLADIGTDHAYLPTYLIKSGKINSAIAADINEGPLLTAKETVEKYGISDRVTLCLSNGLDRVDLTSVTDVSIAGMGGELICDIIGRCEALKKNKTNLILQPMTNAEVLREYLSKNGFEILSERAVLDKRFVYCIMNVVYTGKAFTPDRLFCTLGNFTKNSDLNSRAYVAHQIKRQQKKIEGIKCSKNREDLEKEIEFLDLLVKAEDDIC